jgi:hypothetical protein
MLEIKNDGNIPVDLVLSPVQHHNDFIQISVPNNGSFSSNVGGGCTKFLKVIKSGESETFWEGVIPTCISNPIMIDTVNNALTYNGRKLIGKTYSSFISSFTSLSSTYTNIALVLLLLILSVWLYKKYRK